MMVLRIHFAINSSIASSAGASICRISGWPWHKNDVNEMDSCHGRCIVLSCFDIVDLLFFFSDFFFRAIAIA